MNSIVRRANRAVFPSSYTAYRDLKKVMKRYDAKKTGRKAKESNALAQAKKIGFDLNSGTSRIFSVGAGTGLVNTRQLYQSGLLGIPRLDSNFHVGTRSRDVINVSGFKIMYHFDASDLNTVDANFRSGYGINIAVLGLRNQNFEVEATGFFLGGSNDNRAVDFTEALSFNDIYQQPVNTDEYVVLWQSKKLISWQSTPPCFTGTAWVPFKRQVRYNAGGTPSENVRVVWWVDKAISLGGQTKLTPATSPPTRLFGDILTFTYFRDVN